MIQTSVQGITGSEIHLKLIFDLPVEYPSSLPNISVNSEELSRAQCKDVREKLVEQAKQHILDPMIHDLVVWTQQNQNNLIAQPEPSILEGQFPLSLDTITEEATWTILLRLNHMRAKSKYVKTVEKWTNDLKLCGRLMFLGKIILILLQGDRQSTRDYLVLQKTCKVDVDSMGKKCKEKMISVLCETILPLKQKRFTTFEVKEYSSVSDLQKEFEAAGLRQFSLNLYKLFSNGWKVHRYLREVYLLAEIANEMKSTVVGDKKWKLSAVISLSCSPYFVNKTITKIIFLYYSAFNIMWVAKN